MPKFVITEVWTRSRVVAARNETEALRKGDPTNFPFTVDLDPGAQEGDRVDVEPDDLELNLSNWHATEVK